MPDFEGNYFKPTPENLQRRREIESRVWASFSEAVKDLDGQCRDAFGIHPEATPEEAFKFMEGIAEHIHGETQKIKGETVFTIFLRGRLLFHYTLPRLVMDGPTKGSVQYQFKKVEDNEDEK